MPDETPTRSSVEIERAVLSRTLTANASLVAEVLEAQESSDDESLVRAIAATRSLGVVVDDVLRALVDQARADGRTWSEIGRLLHVTRQAAFQRFGGAGRSSAPSGDRDGEPLTDAAALAATTIQRFLDRRWDELRAGFDERMLAACPVELLADVHRQMSSAGGPVEELGAPTIRVRGGYTVVDIPIALAGGDWTGEVSLDADRQVAGLFILPPESR
ncbi:MAG: hypothetical protein ABSH51_20260 [Solirubrobacteraceae bacterium]